MRGLRPVAAAVFIAALPARAPAQRTWQTAVGLSAGYTRTHLHGLGLVVDFTSLTAPALGSFGGVPTPPTLFAVFPIRGRLALEPGLDVHRSQSGGTTDFSGNLALRLNYAVTGGWYSSAGGNLHFTQSTGSAAIAQAGVNVAWGYRFHLAGSLHGRCEASFTMFKEREGLPFAVNTFGLMLGAMIPLK